MLKTQQVERALVSKLGFEITETRHRVFRLWLDGQLVVRTYISHGERELSAFHAAQMAKQVQLSKEQFFDAVNCPLSQEEYYDILRAQRE